MPIMRKKKQQTRGNIIYLPVEEIRPSPVQPRKHFNRTGLEELSASISEHGVLQPLTVRMRNGLYELIAGERRLRASKMAGLLEVPCILLNVTMEESSLIALVENLQRKDLDVIEEAEGIAQLIRMYGMSQEEAARRLGKSQSSVANKLRILRLPPDVLERVRSAELSERHARALLRLRKPDAQRYALDYILQQNLNVAATESFIDYLLSDPIENTSGSIPEPESEVLNKRVHPGIFAEPEIDNPLNEKLPEPELVAVSDEINSTRDKSKGGKVMFLLQDVRIFLNSLARGLEVMKQGGIDVAVDKRETNTDLVLTINIPKKALPRKNNNSQDS